MTSPSPFEPSPLDPADWEDFRRNAHNVLDACVDALAHSRERPWRPMEESLRAKLALGDAMDGAGLEALADELIQDILPHATGNTHPRFFGWVHGSGLAACVLAEMVAATMNSNCGGRDHGAVYVERAVIEWCRRCFGLPKGASGVLVTGTSQATVVALATARLKALGEATRQNGVQGEPKLTAYAREGAHSSIVKTLELIGLGSSALRRVPLDADTGSMDLAALRHRVAEDRAKGFKPYCVIGTAGSVDTGDFDDFNALSDFCRHEDIWLHIDGAFGAWVCLAQEPWKSLASGLHKADSIACDFHKWMFVQYSCGVALIRDEKTHRAAFASRPAYLIGRQQGLAGGDPWFCDYGVDLSRGFLALKVWSALRAYGAKRLGEAITRDCQLAALMGRLVDASPDLRLASPVRMNICCFSAAPHCLDVARQSAFNLLLAEELQLDGEAVFSTTCVDRRTVLRAAIVNHRTCEADIHEVIAAVEDKRTELLQRKSIA